MLVPQIATHVVAPVHALLVVRQSTLFETLHHLLSRLGVAVTVEHHCQLRHAVEVLHLLMVAQGVAVEIVVATLVVFLLRLFRVETAQIEIIDVYRAVFFGFAAAQVVVVVLLVDICQSPFHRLFQASFLQGLFSHHVAQAAVVCQDSSGNIVVLVATAGYPTPGTALHLVDAQFAGRFGKVLLQRGVVEEVADALFAGTLPFPVAQPGSFAQQHLCQGFVLHQRTLQGFGLIVAPSSKGCFHLRVLLQEIAPQGVCVEAAAQIEIAGIFVVFHIGQCLHGIPDGIGRYLGREAMILQGVALAFLEVCQGVALLALTIYIQTHTLGDQRTVGEYGDNTLLAVAARLTVGDDTVCHGIELSLRHVEVEDNLLRAAGCQLNGLPSHAVLFTLRAARHNDVEHFACGGIQHLKGNRYGLVCLRGVAHFDGKIHFVALTQEARHVGHGHQFLVGYGLVYKTAHLQILGVSQAFNMPLRQ